MKGCPLCDAGPGLLEHMTREREFFCNGCGTHYVLNEDGVCVWWSDTNHTADAPRKRVRTFKPQFSGTLNPRGLTIRQLRV